VIETLSLFESLDHELLTLLRSLSRQEWGRQTIAGVWTVRDVVAHLLDTPLRRLSFVRDGWPPEVDIRSEADLVALVDAMNAEGVRTYGRLSPAVLIDLMALATAQLRAHLAGTAPEDEAGFPVSWAGESRSPHWFDVAREYTERWHHQAQVRLALGALAPLMAPRFYAPLVATFMRALPHALRGVASADGGRIVVVVDGPGGGTWTATRELGAWHLDGPVPTSAAEGAPRPPHAIGSDAEPLAHVTIPADIAWRLFTKGASADEIARTCQISGDVNLAAAVLRSRAIVG
jgi:uncharacterized protein (TIGR03083 family)